MRTLIKTAICTAFIANTLHGQNVNLLEKETKKKTVLEDHIITLGPSGALRAIGQGAKTEKDLKEIFLKKLPQSMKPFDKKRIFLYAHGGLVEERWGRADAKEYYEKFLPKGVYPITFVWPSDVPTMMKNGGENFAFRVYKNINNPDLDFAKRIDVDELNKLRIIAKDKKDQDKLFEDTAFHCSGAAVWQKMKDKAFAATRNNRGGARLAAKYLAQLCKMMPDLEIHVSGHSAGSIFMGPFVQLLTKKHGLKIKTVQLRAPACTFSLFEKYYLPSLKGESIENFIVMNLTDEKERSDGWSMYGKSILYLVSNGLEKERGAELLGMEKFYALNRTLKGLVQDKKIDYIACPNEKAASKARRSGANTHGSFAHEKLTIEATLAQILYPQPIQ